MSQYIFNLKPSPKDLRDFHYHATTPITVPSSLDLSSKCSPIVDQGKEGSCVANCLVSGVREYNLMLKQPLTDRLSRQFLYNETRINENTLNQDAGANIRDALDVLIHTGVCKETLFPYLPTDISTVPPDVAVQDASNYKITSYAGITTGIQGVKEALTEGLLVAIGMAVYNSMESDVVSKTGILPMPNLNTETVIGGHAIVIVGWEDCKCWFTKANAGRGYFKVRNSWGNTWGQSGYFMMPYSYFNNYVFEAWTAV